MIASRTAALTGAAACGNDSVVRDILRPQREGQVRERTDGVGVDSREPTSGRTALHFAILNDRLTTVDLLLSLGADPTIADGSGRRACHMCVVPKRHQILDRILATAAARGEVDVVLGARDALARCPHHLAASKGDKAAVATILDAKPDLLNMGDCTGRTALWLACARACETSGPAREAFVATMDLLMRRGADPNVRDAERGETLLGWLARTGEAAMVRRVLRDFDGAWGPRVELDVLDTYLERSPLDWVALRAEPAAGAFSGVFVFDPTRTPSPRQQQLTARQNAGEEGRPPYDPACCLALVDGGARVGERHEALIARARTEDLPPIPDFEREKSLHVLHTRLRQVAHSRLDVHDDDENEDAAVERLEASLDAYNTADGEDAPLSLVDFHAALRGALRVKPSLANDHDVSQVWARLNKHGQTASARTFLKWVGLAKKHAKKVEDAKRASKMMTMIGSASAFSSGAGGKSLLMRIAEAEGRETVTRVLKTDDFDVQETIQEMAWTSGAWRETEEEMYHTFLATRNTSSAKGKRRGTRR